MFMSAFEEQDDDAFLFGALPFCICVDESKDKQVFVSQRIIQIVVGRF